MESLIATVRSLGFGALFGAGVAGLVYALAPTLFAGAGSLEHFMYVGGLLGAGLHRAVDTYVVDGLMRPVARFVTFYSALAQLSFLVRWGVLSRKHAAGISRDLTTRYFRGAGSNEPELGP